jgi:hypothetical protein
MRKVTITPIAALLLLFFLAPIAGASTSSYSASSPCALSDLHGNCGPYADSDITLSDGFNTYVSNNGWGCGSPGSCGRQSVVAYNPGHWSVTSQQAAGNTAVLTYPDVSQVFTDVNNINPQFSSFGHIYSTFAESMPAVKGLDAEAGYDIWLSSTSGPGEIMIWVDNVGRGTGGARQIGKASIYNKTYNVLEYGNGEIIFSLNHNEQAGTVHILSTLRWLRRHGYVSAGARVGQVDFGWEICSTGGHQGTFSMSHYTLRSR